MLLKSAVTGLLFVGPLFAGLCFAGRLAAAHAETATAWNEHPNSRVRLIAGEDGLIGVELQLSPGWKTYWRMPGDAGVPPSFEWAGSTNVSDIEVFYPAPMSLPDQGGTAVGYKQSVIFPVKYKRTDAAKTGSLVLEFSYGVCKDVCIPIDSKLSMAVTNDTSIKPSPDLMKATVLVPQRVSATDAAKSYPRLLSTTFDLATAKPHITFATRGATDVFVEAPDGLFVPLTKGTSGTDGHATFVVDLSKSPDVKDLAGKTLRITVTGEMRSIETQLELR
jgi:DsbC/DsbD-like thiol-disulfide interchange protein